MNRSFCCIGISDVVLATHCAAGGDCWFRIVGMGGVTLVKAHVDDDNDDARILLGCAATNDKNAKLCHSLLDRTVAAVRVVALIIPPSKLIASRSTRLPLALTPSFVAVSKLG